MKKVIATAAILGIISLAGVQAVSAHGGYNDSDYGYCGSYTTDVSGITKEDAEAIEKFRSETSAIRKEIVVKRSELNALLSKDNPDEKRVAELTGDLFDLETELDAKAEKVEGLDRYARGRGPGMMHGYGWGYGRHMMNW